MNKTITLLLAISLSAAGSLVFAEERAQEPPFAVAQGKINAPPLDRENGNPPSDEKREEIRKKIEAVRIWRLTEELKLDQAMSARLSSLLSSIEQNRRDIQREQMEAMRSLRQTLRSMKPDEAVLKQLLEKLERNHRSMQELRDREISSLKEILSPEQQARFLLFQQEFMREMRGMIDNVRGGGQGRGLGQGGGRMRGGNPGVPLDR